MVAKDGLFLLSIVTSSQLNCDVTRMQGTGIIMSYWFLRVQTGTKLMPTI